MILVQRRKTDAIEILEHRLIGGDSEMKAALERETINAEIAFTIALLRSQAGLTQKDLAERVGTTQSAISRLEDASYEGHSLTMLNRVAGALGHKLRINLEAESPRKDPLRMAFRELLRRCRLARNLSIHQFATNLDISTSEALLLEQSDSYLPSPLLLYRISKLVDIPQRRLATLIGAVRDVPTDMHHQASRFAAMSESFAKLTPAEQKELDRFVQFLRSQV
jgi:transcriptional regulator with XRE-family HTH domain